MAASVGALIGGDIQEVAEVTIYPLEQIFRIHLGMMGKRYHIKAEQNTTVCIS